MMPHTSRSSLVTLSLLLVSALLVACEEKAPATTPPAQPETPPSSPAVAADTTPPTTPTPPAAVAAGEAGEEEEVFPDADPIAGSAEGNIPQEVDPSATQEVTAVELKDADLEGLTLPGKRQRVIGWTDRYGTNAVVITEQPQANNGGLLTATHGRREGDASWTTVVTLKELVKECADFDLTLMVKTGDWSVTDLNQDGLGEATFAWSAGCRSDVSPITHKVLMIEDGKKYPLRGETIPDEAMAGDARKPTPDGAFKSAPPSFLTHAQSAWDKTVKER